MGIPGKWRVGGDAALFFIRNVQQNLTLVHLENREHLNMLEDAASASFVGGAIYGALLGRCALKAKTEIIYTWNTKDFLRLPAEIAGRVRRPDQ